MNWQETTPQKAKLYTLFPSPFLRLKKTEEELLESVARN